jgi:hypothetical protein
LAPPKAVVAPTGIPLFNSTLGNADVKFTLGPGDTVDGLIISAFKDAAAAYGPNGAIGALKTAVWGVMGKYSRLELELTTNPVDDSPAFTLKSFIQVRQRGTQFEFERQPAVGLEAMLRFGSQRRLFMGIQGSIPARDTVLPNTEDIPGIKLFGGREW